MKFPKQERRCAELLLQAKGDKEIAETMGLSFQTVKGMMGKMFMRMRLTSGMNKRILLAMEVHRRRSEFGVRCQACGEI